MKSNIWIFFLGLLWGVPALSAKKMVVHQRDIAAMRSAEIIEIKKSVRLCRSLVDQYQEHNTRLVALCRQKSIDQASIARLSQHTSYLAGEIGALVDEINLRKSSNLHRIEHGFPFIYTDASLYRLRKEFLYRLDTYLGQSTHRINPGKITGTLNEIERFINHLKAPISDQRGR